MYADPDFNNGASCTVPPPLILPPPCDMLLWYAARGLAIAQKREPIPGTKNPRPRDWLPPVVQIIRRPGWLTSLQTYAGMAAELDAAPQSLKDCLFRAFDQHGIEQNLIDRIVERVETSLNV